MASGRVGFLWVYLLAPMVGSAAAATVLNRAHNHHAALTHRLCGTHADGSDLHAPE